jgi:hypothetical protein
MLETAYCVKWNHEPINLVPCRQRDFQSFASAAATPRVPLDNLLLIGGLNLTATKARLLLMACLMKFGSLPPAADPDQPTPAEAARVREKVAAYQTVFDTHRAASSLRLCLNTWQEGPIRPDPRSAAGPVGSIKEAAGGPGGRRQAEGGLCGRKRRRTRHKKKVVPRDPTRSMKGRGPAKGWQRGVPVRATTSGAASSRDPRTDRAGQAEKTGPVLCERRRGLGPAATAMSENAAATAYASAVWRVVVPTQIWPAQGLMKCHNDMGVQWLPVAISVFRAWMGP